jgi:hypothetical protein
VGEEDGVDAADKGFEGANVGEEEGELPGS